MDFGHLPVGLRGKAVGGFGAVNIFKPGSHSRVVDVGHNQAGGRHRFDKSGKSVKHVRQMGVDVGVVVFQIGDDGNKGIKVVEPGGWIRVRVGDVLVGFGNKVGGSLIETPRSAQGGDVADADGKTRIKPPLGQNRGD